MPGTEDRDAEELLPADPDSRERVQRVADGTAQFTELTDDERAAAHAVIDRRISRTADEAHFGQRPT